MQNVARVNTSTQRLEALHAPAKRKADDQHSDVEKKNLKGDITFVICPIAKHIMDTL